MSTTCQRAPDYCRLPNGHPGFCFGKQELLYTPKLGQDGKPHRLCADEGCFFKGRHVVNCLKCLGFGLPDGEPCPECGGTPNGRGPRIMSNPEHSRNGRTPLRWPTDIDDSIGYWDPSEGALVIDGTAVRERGLDMDEIRLFVERSFGSVLHGG